MLRTTETEQAVETRSAYGTGTPLQTTMPKPHTLTQTPARDSAMSALPGAPMLMANFALLAGAIWSVLTGAGLMWAIPLWFTWLVSLAGFFSVAPNDSRVFTLFGKYTGTIKSNGFFWVNPFMSKRAVSLRARTLNGEKLKVNDLSGNPIEIAAIVVWRVSDTYSAVFEVEDYEQYVALQSESAVRQLASTHPYDTDSETEVSLRRNTVVVCDDLERELQERLAPAGIQIIEARLSHLAYAPEIASAMLRRQQAAAVISARQRIVEGAVGMVEMALKRLEADKIVMMTEEQKAKTVSNLLVVLCSEHSAQPVVNTGMHNG